MYRKFEDSKMFHIYIRKVVLEVKFQSKNIIIHTATRCMNVELSRCYEQ